MKIRDEGLRRALDHNSVNLEDDDAREQLAALVDLEWSSHDIWHHESASTDDVNFVPKLFKGINSLDGLQGATSLERLSLNGNHITTLKPLAPLTEIKELWLQQNDLRNISDVAGMKKLQMAYFDGNRSLEDISALAGATELRQLKINNTSVTDVTCLSELPNLMEVTLRGLSFDEDSASFETLVELTMRGVKCIGDEELIKAVKAEVGRRMLATETSEDAARDALADAGLHDLAARWAAEGPAAIDESGDTILHTLASIDLDEEVREKLTRVVATAGGDLNAGEHTGDYPKGSPLGIATQFVQYGRPVSYLQTLLDLGADPNETVTRPALSFAVEIEDDEKRVEAIETLLAGGADPGRSGAFHAIVQHGSLDLVDAAIEAAPDLDAHDGYSGKGALELAAGRKRDDVVARLLSAGADPEKQNSYGETPLYNVRKPSTFDLLVDAGADPTFRHREKTVLFKYVEVAEKTPEAGAELIRRAVEAGVDVNACTHEGETVLHVAAGIRPYGDAVEGFSNVVSLLIELGANVNALKTITGFQHGMSAFELVRADEVKKVLKEAKGVRGKTKSRRLAKTLDGLSDDNEDAWDAARKLAATGPYGRELLEPHAELLQQKLQALDEPLAQAFSAFHPTTESVIVLLSIGPNGEGAYGKPLTHLVTNESERLVTGRNQARTSALEAILAAGADPLKIDGRGTSVLYRYLRSGEPLKLDLVKTMLSPETVNAPSPVATAAERLNDSWRSDEGLELVHEILDLLVEAGADLTDSYTLDTLCRTDRLDLVQRAIESGADPTDGLHSATDADNLEAMRYLLDLGVDPDLGAPKETPIYKVRSLEALEILLEAGADPSLCTKSSKSTPLHSVTQESNIDGPTMIALVMRFEALGLSLDAKSKYGGSPLDNLKRRDDPETTEFLTS